MTDDPIVEEVRRWREEYAARFNFDLDAIFADLHRNTEQARQAGQAVVSLPSRRVEPSDLREKQPTGRRAG